MDLTTLHADFAAAHLVVEQRGGTEWSVRCPIHGESHASMRFNIEKGVWFCHGCGARGTVGQLAKFLGVPWTAGQDPETQMSLLRSKLHKLIKPEPGTEVEYWGEERLQRFTRIPTSYWTDPVPLGRGFTEDTIDAFDLGYDPMEDHAIIPIRDIEGRILGVTRRFLDTPKRTYRDPKGFVKGDNLFASWLAKQSPHHYVVLTEGPLDAIKVWQAGHPAVAQYGSKLTPRQIKQLKDLGVTTIVIAYDNDAGGLECRDYAFGWRDLLNARGYKQRFYLAECDLRNFFVIKSVTYPPKVKDPGDMDDADLHEMICAAVRIGYSDR